MRAQAGQSTLEYAALVLLALLVLAAGAVVVPATGIAQAVVAQITRALCLVGRGDCDTERTPCVLSARTTTSDASLRVAVVRLGGGRTVVRERLADGSEIVTVLSRGTAGVGLAVGAEGRVGRAGTGAVIDGSFTAALGRGRSWRVRGPRAGDDLLRRLAASARAPRHLTRARLPPAPPPDVVLGERGLDTTLLARMDRIGLSLQAADVLASRRERSDGTRTLVLRRRNALVGEAGLLGLGVRARALRDQRSALRIDAAGRPLELRVTAAVLLDGEARVPSALRGVLGPGGAAGTRGRLVEVERRLDLRDPRNLAAAAAYVRALREPGLGVGDSLAVSDALGRQLDADGVADARLYAFGERRSGVRGNVSAGMGAGATAERVVQTRRLLSAVVRPPGGGWTANPDCA